MTKRLLLIGIGAGDPEHVTVQAVRAMNEVDVFFVLDKGGDRSELARARTDIVSRYVTNAAARVVEVSDPERDRSSSRYDAAVAEWDDRRATVYERLVDDELDDDGCGGILVWGDPALYDGALRVIERMLERGHVQFEYEVVPGITAVQALAARHRIPLARVGEAVEITTGRRLRDHGLPPDVDNVVVMLDRGGAFGAVLDTEIGSDLEIYWGAYLGTADEIVDSGLLVERADAIEEVRREARERKGWVMDTFLLRRAPRQRADT